MSERYVFLAESEADTARLGAALAAELPPGAVVALHGTLGAGKTRLVQAVAAGWGIDPREVVSPTFVLATEHHGRRSLYHVDAYRLHDEDEFEALGQQEHFGGPGVVFIEWAERIAGSLPRELVEVFVEATGDQTRRFTLASNWSEGQRCLHGLKQRLAAPRG
ncbi:MAG: tRNA (adenosine(37)-N6)-threonylcarbamoyltransferase complex ATPase subunit type 1 TsaE [Pirellulales bacterium]